MITSQVTMQKILHIPEKYSLFPNIRQGIKSKMTPPLPCLPNQGKIILLNWTKSSDGVKWQRCLGGCAEFGNCLRVFIQLLMLYLYQSSVFLNEFWLKAKIAKNTHRAEQRTAEESWHWRARARWSWSGLKLASKFSQNFHMTYLRHRIRSVIVLLLGKGRQALAEVAESTSQLKSPFGSTSLPLTDVDESCPWCVTELKGGSTLPHCFWMSHN